jgi:signal transduction histidine kinase/ligand-binding sensor domain-containing protein
MKEKICFFSTITLLITFQTVFAQNNTVPFYKVDSLDGTQLGRITGITQDPAGIMWFAGAEQRCLYRYDGNTLTSFKRDAKNSGSLGLNFLETIYADDRGLIWIGGDGLDQYNPETGIFKHFTHSDNDDSSINKGAVFAILKDHTGNMWVGTDQGLDRLDERTGKFIHYQYDSSNPKSLSNNVVEVLYEDKKGVLWIGTGLPWSGINGDGGLNRMNPDGSFTHYMHDPKNPNSLLSNKVRAIFEDSRGNFWVGTSGDGLHTMDREKGTFERHPYDPKHPNQLSGPLIHPIPRAGAGGVTYIYEDKIGGIWIGSYLEGLSRYDPITKQMTRYRGGNGFPDSTTYRGFIGRDGTLWVAADDNRLLYRADPGSKTITNIYTGYQVWGILPDNGKIWVTSSGGGLLLYDENRTLIRRFRHDPKDPSSIPNDSVNHLLRISDHTFWVSTAGGMVELNTISNKFSRLSLGKNFDSLKFGFGYAFKDKDQDIWFTTIEGLIQYNLHDSSVKKWFPDPADSGSIGSRFISFIFEDKERNLWFGTWQEKLGIWKFNRSTGKFRWYLPGTVGRNMYEDQGGNIWAGTNNGLYLYDKKEDGFLPFFDSQSRIRNELTVGMVEDNKNNLWVNTPSSVIKINRDRNSFFVFGQKFGISLQDEVFSGYMSLSSKGQILVSNSTGFYAFYPEELDVDMSPLQIVITDFFFNEAYGQTENNSSLLRSAEKSSEISLAHDQNNFGFKFTVHDYRPPDATRYYTMLVNYDPVWRQSGADKTVYYFNLAPGDYVFKIKAYNGNELKGEKQVMIHISPPWWKTGWAYAVYGLLLVGIIFSITRLQKQRIIQQERQKRQAFELAQAKEIEKAYTELKATQAQLIQSEKMASLGELTAGIAHEIQNPLNFVNNFSEVNRELIGEMKLEIAKGNMEGVVSIAGDIEDNEEKIIHHGKRADAIVKSMLQHSRAGAGQKELTDLNALADEYLRLSFQGLRARDSSFNATIQTDFDQHIGNVNIIPQDIGRALLNLCNNAFYTVSEKMKLQPERYKPTVSVSTKKVGDKIEIRVRDNGNGIPQKVIDKIFQPFFTTKPAGQGTGLGLSLSYDILKAHGGEMKVESKPGEGSEFLMLIPVA